VAGSAGASVADSVVGKVGAGKTRLVAVPEAPATQYNIQPTIVTFAASGGGIVTVSVTLSRCVCVCPPSRDCTPQ